MQAGYNYDIWDLCQNNLWGSREETDMEIHDTILFIFLNYSGMEVEKVFKTSISYVQVKYRTLTFLERWLKKNSKPYFSQWSPVLKPKIQGLLGKNPATVNIRRPLQVRNVYQQISTIIKKCKLNGRYLVWICHNTPKWQTILLINSFWI